MLLGVVHSKLILIYEQVPLLKSFRGSVIYKIFHILCLIIFSQHWYVYTLFGMESLSIFRYSAEICIFILGTVILSFTFLLYLLAEELPIVNRSLTSIMVLVKIAAWNHP